MEFSEMLNWILGGGLLAAVVGLLTLKATVRKANAEAEKAKAEAETVRIGNTEQATRILIENIVEPLKKELSETREDLREAKKELGSTKREMARFRKAIETANSCKSFVLTALLFSSCATSREAVREKVRTVETEQRDSLAREVLRIRTETVPMSEVRLEIPTDSLLKLPEGSSFHAKSGQARLDIGKGRNPEPSWSMPLATACSDSVSITRNPRSVWRKRYEGMADLYEAELKQRSNPVKTFSQGSASG